MARARKGYNKKLKPSFDCVCGKKIQHNRDFDAVAVIFQDGNKGRLDSINIAADVTCKCGRVTRLAGTLAKFDNPDAAQTDMRH